MSNPALPKYFEPYKMADRQAVFQGSAPLSSFTRLEELVADCEGELQVRLEFGVHEEGIRQLTGEAKGIVKVQCQRCLDLMDFALDFQFHIGFAMHDEMATSIPRDLDPIVIRPDEQPNLQDLIEDDLLLAIPEFVSHPPDQCSVTTEFGDPETAEKVESDTSKENPFSVLEQLKDPGKQ